MIGLWLNHVLTQLSAPDAFLEKVRALYNSIDEDTDTLAFRDGRIFERHSAPLMMAGAPVGRVWSFRDSTERKRAEEALRESEEMLRSIFTSISDAVTVTDLSGNISVSATNRHLKSTAIR